MKGVMSKKVVALVIISSIMGTTVAQASELKKDESVYVNLNADGTQEKVTVSDWLHSDNEEDIVYDKSELSDIRNVKSDIEPDRNGQDLIWNMGGRDLYYQGNSDKDIPFNVSVKYYYEDEEVIPEDLAGKSGKVKIEIEIKNKSKKQVNINGKQKDIYTPFVVLGEVTLPDDKFSKVIAEGASIISEGNNNIIAFAKIPGLKETLQLDSIPFAKDNNKFEKINDLTGGKITIEADADEFSLGPIMMAAATDASMLKDLDSPIDLNEYKDMLNSIKDNYDEIIKGDAKLNEGIFKGYSKVMNGLSVLKQPKFREKLSLITNDDKLGRANRLLDDAYYAKDLDTEKADKLLGKVQYGYSFLKSNEYRDLLNSSNKILYDSEFWLNKSNSFMNNNSGLIENRDKIINGYNFIARNKDELAKEFGILKNKSSQVQDMLNDKEVTAKLLSLQKDIQYMQNNYSSLNDSSKKALSEISSLITSENIKDLQNKSAKLTKEQEVLKAAIANAGGIDKFIESFQKSLKTLQTLSKIDFSTIKNDVTSYGSAYLIIRSNLMAANAQGKLDAEKEKLKNNIALIYKGNEDVITSLNRAVDVFSTKLTAEGIKEDCLKISNNTKTLESLSVDIQSLLVFSNEVNIAGSVYSDTQSIKEILNILTGNDKTIEYLQQVVKEISVLPKEQQAVLIELINGLQTLMSHLDKDKEVINEIKSLIGKEGLSEDDINKFNSFVDSLNEAESCINLLQNTSLPVLNSDDVNNTINGFKSYSNEVNNYKSKYLDKYAGELNDLNNYINTPEFQAEYKDSINKITDLMSRQKDLKNSEDILRILRESLKDDEVEEARNLINTLPSYTAQLKELRDGSQSLANGIKMYGDKAINEIYNKGNNGLSFIDELSQVKGEMIKSSNNYGCFSGQDKGMNGSTKFIMKTKEIKYEAPEDDDSNENETTEKKGFFAWIKSLFEKD